MKRSTIALVVVALCASGVQPITASSKRSSKKIEFCNHWKQDIRIGFLVDSDLLTLVKGGSCQQKLNQQKGQFIYVQYAGKLHTLARSFENRRIVAANAAKSGRGVPKRLIVRYEGNERDVYFWNPVKKMFLRQEPIVIQKRQ